MPENDIDLIKLKEKSEKLINALKRENLNDQLEDWLYLIHHIHIDDDGNEVLHHCKLVDHLGNLFDIGHIKDENDKIQHYLVGLTEEQEVYWSNEEAIAAGETIPCANRQLED